MEEHLNMLPGLDLVDLDEFMEEFMDSNNINSMVVCYISEDGIKTKIEKTMVD